MPLEIEEVKTQEQAKMDFEHCIDKVFPSLDEIYYCVKKNLVSKKELILYKLIIDLHEALLNRQSEGLAKSAELLVKCALKFYRSLSEQETKQLLDKMQVINQRMSHK